MNIFYSIALILCGAIFANAQSNGSDSGVRKKIVSIAEALNFFSSDHLLEKWESVKLGLTNSCAVDVEKYIEGLEIGEKWAQKMDDASGRYHTGWFWGNHFWTGSQSLCENIVPKGYKFEKIETNRTRFRRGIEMSPSQSKGFKVGELSYMSPPPFPVSFFMLNINLNSTTKNEETTIHIGLCLPLICTDDDVKNIVQETSTASTFVTIKIDGIRSPHHHYNIWTDNTFRALCIATGIVCVLLLIGTGYDLYVNSEEDQDERSTLKCTTYTEPEHKLSDKPIKFSVADVQAKIGKCNLYVVNNNNHSNNNNNNNLEQPVEITVESNNPEKEAPLIAEVIKHIILSFSVRINVRTICDRTVGSDTISTIHGLKVISMIWVILGHTCIIAFKYSDNMEYRKVVQKEFFFQTVSNGAFSVDTFFFTSGLLVSFLYFRVNANGKLDRLGKKGFLSGCLHFGGLILYRFARLSVPYLFVLGLVEVCMRWFNYNSIFEPPTMDHVNCPKYWWRNILYVNTLFPVQEMCMLWSWYLSDDTQFYILGAILLIVAVSYFKTAAIALSVFLLSSWMMTGYVALSNGYTPTTDDPLALFDQIYDKPYTRLGPYLIGMAIGWVLFKTNCRIKMSKLTVVVGWLVSSACLLSILYGLYEVDLSPLAGAAYSCLSHSAWALALAWIIIACATGHGGLVNGILSATILYPISRITYCAYLLHPLVMRVMVMNMDSPLHLGKPLMVTVFLGQVLASYAIGFLVSVMYEAPVVTMLKILPKVAQRKPKIVST